MDLLIPATIIYALLLDLLFGEPRKFHPLVGFGKLANWLEKRLNLSNRQGSTLKEASNQHFQIILGSFAATLLLLPCALLFIILAQFSSALLTTTLNVLVLYWAIGHQSLREHAYRVFEQCQIGELEASRQQLAMIVSRDTGHLNQQQVVQATIETVLENGSDAIFAPIFWFVVLEVTIGFGAAAVLVYRLSNTLDAMWGYRNPRFNHFGRFAARLDDVLNYFPARIVALSYALLGNTLLALKCWRQQSPLLKSPNAGPVMTAGAGSLDLCLGGPSYYHQVYIEKPYFGSEKVVDVTDIERSLRLIQHTIWLWCLVTTAVTILLYLA